MNRTIVGVVVAVVLLGTGSRARGAEELEVLRRAIQERRERVAAFERRERGLFEAIEAVDEAIHAMRIQADRAASDAREAQQALDSLEARSADLEARVASTQVALGRRATALYKSGELGPVSLVFAPGSLRDRLGRIQALQLLMDHDGQLLVRFHQESTQLERSRVDARAAAERRDEAHQRLAARSADLDQERAAKRDLLVAVRRDRARERAVLNELEAAARALEETLAHLQAAPLRPGAPAGSGFSQLRGRLDPPVIGPVVRDFGRVVDEEYRTQTFRKGIDFGVAVGEPVYAVAQGQVRFAGWFRGYGKLAIVDHGDDFFTVSGHLDELLVEVGDGVEAGDRIGLAGETGSLSGPRLYFEIRRDGDALDPAEWLQLLPEG